MYTIERYTFLCISVICVTCLCTEENVLTCERKSILKMTADPANRTYFPCNGAFQDRQYIKVLENLHICGWNKAVLFTGLDISDQVTNFIMKLLNESSISFLHYVETGINSNDTWIMEILWYLYTVKYLNNFMFIHGDPVKIILQVNELFVKDQRGIGARMAHNLQLIVFSFTKGILEITQHVSEVRLDNVAVLAADESTMCIEAIYTLMWRDKRIREFERVMDTSFFDTFDDLKTFNIFPNLGNQLNGRQFAVLAKEWMPYLIIQKDPATGELTYQGFIVELLNALANSLNFTYILTPRPGDKSNITTWIMFSQLVAEARVDFGASLFPTSTLASINHTVTAPLLFSNVTGIYIKPDISINYDMFQVLQSEVYWCIVGCLIFIVVYYILICIVLPVSRDNGYSTLPDSRLKRATERYMALVELFFRFVGSVFNQGSLPSPSSLSGRLLLWSWCLMLVVLYATFTGNLTADLVGNSDRVPFDTFEGMMARKDFRWGLDAGSTTFATMKDAKEDSLLKKLYRGVLKFASEDKEVTGNITYQISNVNAGHYVGIMLSVDIINYRFTNTPNLVMLKEAVLNSAMGVIFPNHSAMTSIFSHELLSFWDYGIIDFLQRKTVPSPQVDTNVPNVGRSRSLDSMLGIFLICGVGLLISTCVLVVECSMMYLVKLRHKLIAWGVDGIDKKPETVMQ